MRIGIDCRLAGTTHAGIGRYIYHLLIELGHLNSDFNFVLFFSNQKQAHEIMEQIENKSNFQAIIVSVSHYSILEQIRLPGIFKQAELDLLHVPHFNVPIFYQGLLMITIHDLLWHHYRGSHVTTLDPIRYWLKYVFYRIVVNSAIAKALTILVPTQTVKALIVQYYPKSKNKISITPEGVSLPVITKSKLRIIDSDYLLYVGSLYPHKNIKVVLEAITKLPQISLKIVSARNPFHDQVKKLVCKLKIEDQVEFLGYVNDKKLSSLYTNSLATIQPSLSEGFGLTGLEALACESLLIASDIPVFREVYQDSALFFDPTSATLLLEAINEIQNLSPQEQKKRLSKGKHLASKYQWSNTAQLTLNSYSDLLKNISTHE